MAFNQGHALIIGVGTYMHTPQMNVPITAADAEAVATVLRNPTYCGYPDKQVVLLRDGTATRDGILAALDALTAQAGENDTIVLFYSGHGHTGTDGNYYLTTHDTRLTNGQVTPNTGVSENDLIAKLRDLPAQRILVLINACHAGELSPVLEPGAPPFTGTPIPEKTAATLLATGTGRVIITACREEQYAYIGNGALTFFTQALVHGLQGKGDYVSNHQGFISVFDLYNHLYDTVQNQVAQHIPADVRQRYSAQQEPELTVLKGVGPFPVALYRGATTLGEFQAPSYTPAEGAVNEVDEERHERLASRLHQQTIGDHAHVGAAVAGDVHGNISVDQHQETLHAPGAQGLIAHATGPVSQHFGDQRNIHTSGGAYAEGNIDQRSGSFVGGDNISVGDITGASGIAVGRQAHAEVHREDQRKGTFVTGDQFTMSGNFTGAMLTIKSTLEHVNQSIANAPHGDSNTKEQLQQLIAQLNTELQKAPADAEADAEAVAEMAQDLVAKATREQPNKRLVQLSAQGLKQAAVNIGAVLPPVLHIAEQIAATVGRMIA